jgi:CheY-like chemotaxis protein
MTKSRRIVLIDDDPINNLISSKIIAFFTDYNAISFTHAGEALEHLRACEQSGEEFPEFIFLDINMPEIDGWQFLEHFEKLPAEVTETCSVIMLTSSIDVNDIEKSKKYRSVRDFISKPLTADNIKLLEKVTRP